MAGNASTSKTARAKAGAARPRPSGKSAPGARAVEKNILNSRDYREEFISIISDELRTPLSIIKGYMDLASEGILGPVPEHLKDPIDQSKACADRLSRLIDNLLHISRLESGEAHFKFQSVSLHTLIYGTVAGFAKQMKKKGLKADVRVAPDSPLVLVDEEKMREVAAHLLRNAIQHSPMGGRIRVAAGPCPAGRGKKPKGPQRASSVRLCIEDEGEGVAAGGREAAFEAFRQMENPLTRKNEGMGLGLAICKKVIEAHGGAISLRARKGRGTAVEAVWPVDPLSVRSRQGD